MDFEKIYRMYYIQVYSYTLTLVKNQHDAEEITQNTFFKAMKSLSSFKGNSNIYTWLCAIAKNESVDFLRKKRPQELDENLPGKDDFSASLADRETLLEVHRVLHQLDEPYKEVFQLRIFGELSFKEIGTIFGKSENWARVVYHRSRLKIQERMHAND